MSLAFNQGDEIEFHSGHGFIRHVCYNTHTVLVSSNKKVRKVPFHEIKKVNDNVVIISRGLKK